MATAVWDLPGTLVPAGTYESQGQHTAAPGLVFTCMVAGDLPGHWFLQDQPFLTSVPAMGGGPEDEVVFFSHSGRSVALCCCPLVSEYREALRSSLTQQLPSHSGDFGVSQSILEA